MILPGCNLIHGAKRAEEIRKLVCAHPIKTPFGSSSVTISIGVTVGCDNKRSVCDLLREADLSLYAAKKNGRNRVEVFTAGQAAGASQS